LHLAVEAPVQPVEIVVDAARLLADVMQVAKEPVRVLSADRSLIDGATDYRRLSGGSAP
jgi:hypothetical protein